MNTIIKKIKNNQSILIASFQVIVGAILLVREIRDFIILPTTTEADEMFGGVVDLFKYKECTYSLLYLWTILLFTGVSYWINKKLHWLFNQILIITLFSLAGLWLGLFIFFELFNRFELIPFIVVFLLFIVVLLLFVWLEIKMCRKSYLETIGIGSKMKWLAVFLGILSVAIYFLIEYFIWGF